ncbi:MAG: hypothetical protein DRQ97_13170 [Gammaproteobacteria bacterium]|nr:MAG: hypothetical protein DRQ97_13170 [Gammaproteobacteria bacterium]
MKKQTLCGLVFITLLMLAFPVAAEDEEQSWPRVLEGKTRTITMYQPQLDSWKNGALESRAAVSVKQGEGVPVFGAVWISGRFEVDRDTRMVHFSSITVPAVAFPEASKEDQQELTDFLEREIPKWDLSISLDLVLPMLEDAEFDESAEAQLKNSPPEIIVKHEPAVLVIIDGEPKLQDIEDSKLERVVNTPYVIVKHKTTFYLAADTLWYKAFDVMGPWETTNNLPKEVRKVDEALKMQRKKDEQPAAEATEEKPDSRVPMLVVSTVPAELIFVDGELELAPVEDTDLLLVSNTDSDVMFDIAGQDYYVLLSGRWFRSKDLDRGPWTFVPGDELPAPFKEIPAESEVGYVRASVVGTEEAREALLEQAVPQTAAVKSSAGASLEVEYDGSPKFDTVEGTAMKYAVNTAAAVILSGGRYYCCDQGIWYESASPSGGWTVCKEVPDEIYTIPPSNPHYNITYVKVYDSTPEEVYVGYTPGYTGSYVSHGSVVYGTGWYYPSYWSPYHYYPYHSTWGFHVRWNPWYGWGFGLSYSTGPFRLTIGWGGYGGFYGGGYRAGYRHGYHHGGHDGGKRPSHHGNTRPNDNIYGRPSNSDRVAKTQDRNTRQQSKVANNRANNVYTDRSGNVYRRNDNCNWDKRDKGGWAKNNGVPSSGNRARPSTGGTTQPSARPSLPAQPFARDGRSSSGSLNRDYNARQRGSQRSNNFRSSGHSSRGGSMGGMRGGGGGRRR